MLDTLVQARPLLDDDVVAPFAIATARCLAGQDARIDLSVPDDRHDAAAFEERSVADAYQRLGPDGQRTLAGTAAAQERAAIPELLGDDDFPTPACRPVLLAIATGNRPAQQRLDAGRHLLDCERCGPLGQVVAAPPPSPTPSYSPEEEPRRRRRWPAILVAALVLLGLTALAYAFLRPTTSETEAEGRRNEGSSSSSTSGTGTATATPLTIGPDDVAGLAAGSALADRVGQRVMVEAVAVEAVAADEGFWIGTGPSERLWVQLTGEGESDVVIQPGRTVTFEGVVTANQDDMVTAIGLDPAEGAAELEGQGAHLRVPAEDVELSAPAN